MCLWSKMQKQTLSIQAYVPEDDDNAIDDTHIEITEDEEYCDLYVENNFSEIYEKFVNSKRQINCYFCNYWSKSKILRN